MSQKRSVSDDWRTNNRSVEKQTKRIENNSKNNSTSSTKHRHQSTPIVEKYTCNGINPKMIERARHSIEKDFDSGFVVGQGTYGVVERAVDKKKRVTVAIKAFKATKPGEGISPSALREIALLKELKHENIVNLRDVYVDPSHFLLKVVYDYSEYELCKIVHFHRKQKTNLKPEMIRSVIYQIICGLQFLHKNWVVHRDLKPSNVLIMGGRDEAGTVKIADFGLARSLLAPLRPLLRNVVTIWYRPPELLLGAKDYCASIDMWAVGCILGELVLREAMFQGVVKNSDFEEDQLRKIFDKLGTIQVNQWPEVVQFPYWKSVEIWEKQSSIMSQLFDTRTSLYDLMMKCLDFHPLRRFTADAALDHMFFKQARNAPSKEAVAAELGSYPVARPKPKSNVRHGNVKR